MFNFEAVHSSKRKQDSSNVDLVNDVFNTESSNSKKQRLSHDYHVKHDETTQYHLNKNNNLNGYSIPDSNHLQSGYVIANANNDIPPMNGQLTVDSTISETSDMNDMENGFHIQSDKSDNIVTNSGYGMAEPMECTEEPNKLNVTLNGNVSSSNRKYCPHGHLNSCTTYNVPCRYPRMYCHPGGMLHDRLGVYHGF